MKHNKKIDGLEGMTAEIPFPQETSGGYDLYARTLQHVVYENLRATVYACTWTGFKWWPEVQAYELTLTLHAGLLPGVSGQITVTEHFDPSKGIRAEIERLNKLAEGLSIYAAASYRVHDSNTDPDIVRAQRKNVGKTLAEAWGYVVD